MTVLQRPFVADDLEHPLACEFHLVEHLLREVRAVAECKVHLRDAFVGLRQRHLDVVDERGEQRPFLVCLAQRGEVAERLACGAEAIPGGEVDAGLGPREDPRDRTQIVERLGSQAALRRAGTDRQQADLGQRRDDREPWREVLAVEQIKERFM